MSHDSFNTGDDSVLLKYRNPHLLLVATVSVPSPTLDETNETVSVYEPTLYINLVDTVSMKTVYRVALPDASPPVHMEMLDHRVFASYWSDRVRICAGVWRRRY